MKKFTVEYDDDLCLKLSEIEGEFKDDDLELEFTTFMYYLKAVIMRGSRDIVECLEEYYQKGEPIWHALYKIAEETRKIQDEVKKGRKEERP